MSHDYIERVSSWLDTIAAPGLGDFGSFSSADTLGDTTETSLKPSYKRKRSHNTGAELPSPLSSVMSDRGDSRIGVDDPFTALRLPIQSVPAPPSRPGSPNKRQRTDDNGVSEDVDKTPKLSRQAPFLPHLGRFKPSSSPRSRSPSPVKTSTDLQLLTKPVKVRVLPNKPQDVLPSNIYPLYKKIRDFAEKEGIVPREAQQALKTLLGGEDEVKDRWFHDRELPAARDVQQELQEIQRIVKQSTLSMDAYEDARGFWVYFPMLRLAFGDQIDPDEQADEHAVVVEPIASAGIAKSCVPRVATTDSEMASVYACSYAESTVSGSTASEGGGTTISGREHNRGQAGGGKKVDYAVILQSRRDSRLHNAVLNACLSLASRTGGKRHVNQTDYQKIQLDPIATAIEAKRQKTGGDRAVQLGLWTAAWHIRMEQFREQRRKRKNPGESSEESSEQNLEKGPGQNASVHHGPDQGTSLGMNQGTNDGWIVPLPLISIDGSAWNLYIACDVGTAIHMYGPIPIGDTSQVADAYVLLACLGALKDWIRGTFREWIEDFFLT